MIQNNKTFISRYFIANAETRFLINNLKFMLWHKGEFIRPHQKKVMLNKFFDEEIQNFKNNIINIPSLQFFLTSRCTLRCKNCNALIPDWFKTKNIFDYDPSMFENDLQSLNNTCNHIRRFSLLGGEPFCHPHFKEFLKISLESNIIDIIEITTNCTIIPSNEILDFAKIHNDRVFFHLSNYSTNQKIFDKLHYNEIIKELRNRKIKFQMTTNPVWSKEYPFTIANSPEYGKKVFSDCWRKRCLQVFDGKIAICPKASSGYVLGKIINSDVETVNLRNNDNLKERLLNFYAKNDFNACRSCVFSDETVMPAEQI